MKYLTIFCLFFLSSCMMYPGYRVGFSTVNTFYNPNYSYNYYRPYYNWYPRPNYLGNVYNNYYYNPKPRHNHNQTNLPLHNGPIGGRRK